jgi:hypothetical protein
VRRAAVIGAALAAGVAATAWTALTLAGFGHFVAVVPILAFPAAAAAVFALLSGRQSAPESPAATAQDLLAVCIACATLFVSIPPDEILLGGQDPGVYVHVAASVARTGSLVLQEPDLAALTEEERQLVSRNHPGATEPFPGMYLRPDGRVSPQFYHLFPSLMAVAWSIGGIRAALLVNPLLNVAAILALYALASLLLGRRWALAAALVHALSAAQLRQAKFPTAELMTQFFLLAGVALLALATLDDDPPPALAPLAGATLGMSILTRYDTILFLVPLAAVLLWGMGPARRTRPVVAALGTLAVFCVQSWLHQRFVAPFYQPLGGMVGAFLAAAALLVPAFLLVRRTGVWRRLGEVFRRRETALRVAAAALLCCWVLFGWFVRPGLAGPGRIGRLFSLLAGDPPRSGFAQLLSGVEAGDMLYLVDLLGAVGLLAALAGIAALIVSRRQLWETAWLAASLAVLVVFTLSVFHDHFLMWVSRRFVPVVMPLASIGIAAAAAFIASGRQGRSPVLAWAGVALVATVVWLNAGATRAMASGREWPGLIAWYEGFERAVPADAELYCDQPGFAAPLRFISGHRAYELPGRTARRIELLIALMRRKASEGREVLFLSQQPFADPPASGLVPLGAYPLRSTMLTNGRRGVPVGSRPRGADFVLYRVQPS